MDPLTTDVILRLRGEIDLTRHPNDSLVEAILDLADELPARDWLRVLGHFWVGFDRIGGYRDRLVALIRRAADNPDGLVPELMSEDELAAFDALPEQITIFRGCGSVNRAGVSWSLDRDAAAVFPFMAAYSADDPMLLTATINKHRAAALKLDRAEAELLLLTPPDDAREESLIRPGCC